MGVSAGKLYQNEARWCQLSALMIFPCPWDSHHGFLLIHLAPWVISLARRRQSSPSPNRFKLCGVSISAFSDHTQLPAPCLVLQVSGLYRGLCYAAKALGSLTTCRFINLRGCTDKAGVPKHGDSSNPNTPSWVHYWPVEMTERQGSGVRPIDCWT